MGAWPGRNGRVSGNRPRLFLCHSLMIVCGRAPGACVRDAIDRVHIGASQDHEPARSAGVLVCASSGSEMETGRCKSGLGGGLSLRLLSNFQNP